MAEVYTRTEGMHHPASLLVFAPRARAYRGVVSAVNLASVADFDNRDHHPVKLNPRNNPVVSDAISPIMTKLLTLQRLAQ
jgi:hypothetical protein